MTSPRPPSIGAAASQLDAAVAAAAAHLLSRRSDDGWWRDFLTPAGESDAWVTGFVGAALAACGRPEARHAAAGAWRLLASRPTRDGGWGYHAGVPTDADSTLWALRLAAALCAAGEPRARTGLAFLLRHLRPGGVTTYADAEPIRRFVALPSWFRFNGWCAPHPCVTAAAAGLAELTGRLAPDLVALQDQDGSWPAYWWFGREYTTGLAATALAAGEDEEGRAAARRAAGWALERLARSSGADAEPEAYAVACALPALAPWAAEAELRDALAESALALARAQRPDGGWASSARLRVPRPDAEDPDRVERWREWRGGPPPAGVWATLERTFDVTSPDHAGLFTCAAALHALTVARGALAGAGEHRRAAAAVSALAAPAAPSETPWQPADPYPGYARLRREEPIKHLPEWGVWAVSRYRDVRRVLGQPEDFSSSPMRAADPFLLGADPPEHREARRRVGADFERRAVARLEPAVRRVIDERIAAIDRLRRPDLVAELAAPLPVEVIADLLDVPPADRAGFRGWADAVVARTTGEDATPGSPAAGGGDDAAYRELGAFLEATLERARRRPAASLPGRLLGGDPPVDRGDLLRFVLLLVIAGTQTTTHLLGNAFRLLLTRGELLERLRSEPEAIPAFVEEALRFESPVQSVLRLTRRETELAGVVLPPGILVMALLGSANRDETEIPDPDRFDLDRPWRRHLAFGAGPHVCLGAHLARLEARLAIAAMLDRLPRMRLIEDEIEWIDSYQLRGPIRLPVEVTEPGARP